MAWIASQFRDDQSSEIKLCFWIKPGAEQPYFVDLTEFDQGSRAGGGPNRRRGHTWAGDFDGRPTFAREFAWFHHFERPNKQVSKAAISALRLLFRWLDTLRGRPVHSVSDLEDGHGWALKEYLGIKGTGERRYRRVKGLVDRMRLMAGAARLFWPTPSADAVSLEEDVDITGVQRLYHALKHEARSIKRMFEEGERLADAGQDPRAISGIRLGDAPAAWNCRQNQAWLVRELDRSKIYTSEDIMAAGARRLRSRTEEGIICDGPSYLAPGMTKRGNTGLSGKLRWFYPGFYDTAIFFWLFLIGTGWNISTALSLDVSETCRWTENHPHKDTFKIIYSYKARAGRHVFALSLEKPEWHPYQIVEYMIARTQPLRERLKSRLTMLETAFGQSGDLSVKIEIDQLTKAVRSPWLFHNMGDLGSVGAFHFGHANFINKSIRSVVRAAGLDAKHPTLISFKSSTARDAWIGRAYSATSHTVLLAQLAAQHSDLRSLKHYLKQRRFRNHSDGVIRRVQIAAFTEIAERRLVDPTRLRILVNGGVVTPEQEKRLLDHRQRTRLGMGCLDPLNPPRHIAPEHPNGEPCRIQRCTGCHHGVIFAESLIPLSRTLAELEHARRAMPLAAWESSSLADELTSIEASLASFDPAEVSAEVAEWTRKLRTGEVTGHDTYPIY